MAMDNRASAIGISRFFLALLVGAVVYWIVESITEPLFKYSADSSSDPVAMEANNYLQTFGGHLPIIFLFFAFFSLLALAIFQREFLRG